MGRYDPLRDFLRKQSQAEIILTFSEIEALLGERLPKSAERPQFWANAVDPHQRHPSNIAAREAGYKSFLVRPDKVRFQRM